VVGCSEELGPEKMPVARVTGSVTEGTRPVTTGWVEFIPVDGTVGNLSSARIRPDGSFESSHVAVGVNLIRLVNAPLSSPGARQVFGGFTSPIRRTISAESTAPVTIDILDESIRVRSAQAAGSGVRGTGETR
jgi:hypothetical protein